MNASLSIPDDPRRTAPPDSPARPTPEEIAEHEADSLAAAEWLEEHAND